ncbi:hypothetical protein COU78_05620 [Candidatus Peregrinibacteria bacterium CG10_big_fil_rev_8_21_14_0_10_49_24]|nr:MAG: hypothetical protein COV83_03405 [Candidatus Peregrinibacteria bacterium CG11_big_fil_rev_8_21_14_0_20_49_14]PIR50606.1 MAG: hypothetical protein COU78_05620 [Candidatus Peregrinibacteria bacterium CG10_big_fil_rev_8_21_14_0_10_49_24]PJA67076.1 MAG: hypothetical protein CO157_06485 [Candidatus Peregrinibacteria bacterium CG_4_9_14_3_um_filter_49_12]
MPSLTQHSTELSKAKRIVFGLVTVGIVFGVTEAFSATALTVLRRGSNVVVADIISGSGSIYRLHPLLVVDPTQNSPDSFNQIVHPYLGAVLEPIEKKTVQFGSADDTMENYGFGPYSGPFIHEYQPDTISVAVVGGSVAKQFVTHGHPDILFKKLAELPKYQGKKFIVSVPTNYGYKQPQQLLAINYLLSIGAHFDMIINLDGFNEVAMPFPENYVQNISPYYPRSWNLRMQNLDLAPEMRRIIGRVGFYRKEQDMLHEKQKHSPLRRFFTAQLLWEMSDQRLKKKIDSGQQELLSQKANERSGYIVTGPGRTYTGDTDFLDDVVSVWKQSSVMLNQIATARGIDYFHALQPNQYVEGSKPMGPEELAATVNPQSHFRQGAISGYPLLRSVGQELRNEGVHFYDMTMVFADQPQRLYIDDCCHMLPEGSAILAERLGEAIVADLSQNP